MLSVAASSLPFLGLASHVSQPWFWSVPGLVQQISQWSVLSRLSSGFCQIVVFLVSRETFNNSRGPEPGLQTSQQRVQSPLGAEFQAAVPASRGQFQLTAFSALICWCLLDPACPCMACPFLLLIRMPPGSLILCINLAGS